MKLTKAYMGFQPGQEIQQVEVYESPVGKTRVQVNGSDETTVQFWCPTEIIERSDLQVAAEPEDIDLQALAARAARILATARPRSLPEIADILNSVYEPSFVELQVKLHDERRLRTKWRGAWIMQCRRREALQRRLDELAAPAEINISTEPDSPEIGRKKMRTHLQNVLRILRDCKMARSDLQHDGVEA